MKDFFTQVPNDLILTGSIPPLEKLVLFYLMCRAGMDNTCFPGIRTIAEGCGVSKKTVTKCLKALESRGLITIRKRFTQYGGNMSNYYTINIE